MCFVMKMRWFSQFMYLIKNLKDSIDLLFLINNNKSHYVYIKDFNTFMFHKTKKQKNGFAEVACNALVVKIF